MQNSYRFLAVLGICLFQFILKSQPIGCQALKSAQIPLYYNAENLRSDTFDILNYTISLEVGSSSSPTLKGHTAIRLAPKLNNRSFVFFDLLQLSVDSVKENNNLLTYSHSGPRLKVNFTTPKNITDTSIIYVYYGGQPVIDATGWGGFYFNNNLGEEYAYNMGVGFGANPHNYGRVWFPCFDNFVEKSKYRFIITCDSARKAYCNGAMVSDVINGAKRTSTWLLSEEIPTYLASVAVARYKRVNWSVNALNGNVPIHLVSTATDTTAFKSGFANLLNCFHGFESYFGPYRWNRLGFCAVPFNGGAMEHATNIAYPRFALGSFLYEELMAHEFSHHWWGDLVTCEAPEDMWINEGMASFSAYLFLEWQYGKKRYLDRVKAEHDDLLHFLFKKEGFRPISGVPHALTYGTHVYTKGADVAHTLRSYMGDTEFFKACKYLMTQRGFKNVNSNEMKTLFQTSSGQNMSDFFNNWVFGPGWPHFSVDSSTYIQVAPGNVATSVYIKQKLFGAPNYYSNVPLELSFFKSDWSREVRTVTVSGANASALVTLSFVPVWCALNYDSKISDATSHEAKIIKAAGTNNYVLGKVFLTVIDAGADSSLLRITHNYVKPDAFKNNTGGHRLSDQHYWKVEGLISPGFKARARFNYDGTKSVSGTFSYLDTALTHVNGDSIGLFHRANAAADWGWVRNAKKIKTNAKVGSLEIDSLMPGEYTFANVGDTAWVSVKKNKLSKSGVIISPNPGKNMVQVSLEERPQEALTLEVSDENGKRALTTRLQEKNNTVDIRGLKPGLYVFEIKNRQGDKITSKVMVQ